MATPFIAVCFLGHLYVFVSHTWVSLWPFWSPSCNQSAISWQHHSTAVQPFTERHLVISSNTCGLVWWNEHHAHLLSLYGSRFKQKLQPFSNRQLDRLAVDLPSNAAHPLLLSSERHLNRHTQTWPYFCKGFASPQGLFAFYWHHFTHTAKQWDQCPLRNTIWNV